MELQITHKKILKNEILGFHHKRTNVEGSGVLPALILSLHSERTQRKVTMHPMDLYN